MRSHASCMVRKMDLRRWLQVAEREKQFYLDIEHCLNH
jgi:hypothetical protein